MDINRGLVIRLVLLHVIIIALSNYMVQFTGAFAGYTFTWAMFVFPVVILATDLTVRLSNPRNARMVVGLAYVPAILISALMADWRIGMASGTAYLVGQLLDIAVFRKIRERTGAWWPAPLISTLVANIIDTYTFFAVAFHRSADEFMAVNWFGIATVDLCFKIVVSVVLFLPAYGALLGWLGDRAERNAGTGNHSAKI